MNGVIYPVSNTLAELEARGGYMTANCGTKLKELYNTSTAVSQIVTKNYTADMHYTHTHTANVKNGTHTPRGQINLRNSATENYKPALPFTRSWTSVDANNDVYQARLSVLYFNQNYPEKGYFTEIYFDN